MEPVRATSVLRAYCPSCKLLRALWRGKCIVCSKWLGKPVSHGRRAEKRNEAMSLCLHCGKFRRFNRLGSCYTCGSARGTDEQVQEAERKRWSWHRDSERPLPPTPTTALPGSLKKIEVMEWRWANGYGVHHPLDLRFVEESRVGFLVPEELEEVA